MMVKKLQYAFFWRSFQENGKLVSRLERRIFGVQGMENSWIGWWGLGGVGEGKEKVSRQGQRWEGDGGVRW